MQLCACGCNKPVTKLGNCFIRGHHTRLPEIRARISTAHAGKRLTEEHKRKISQAHRGLCHTDATKRKISSTLSGRQLSKEHSRNIALALQGHAVSLETREKIRRTKLGDRNPAKRPAVREKISIALKGKRSGTNNPFWGKRHTQKTKEKISKALRGENCWNWRGGLSFKRYDYGFTPSLKEYIRARDKHTCQKCDKSRIENGRALSVHHIDYDKRNHNKSNLIALCHACNAAVNSNRKVWQEYFCGIQQQRLYAFA